MNFSLDPDHFDQHFLVDNTVINKFIDVSNLNMNDTVVEVGPGNGALTNLIAKKVKKLYCIELDVRLKVYLDKICSENKNVEVIYGSALEVDIPKCNKLVTALPYSIVEPFMSKMITTDFDELIMITGNRFASSVESNEINYLSLLTNCFFESEKIMEISPDSFNPKPRTISAMIKLKHKTKEDNKIYSFFKNMYLLNHKKIKNGMIESLITNNYCSTQREARELIDSMSIPEDILDTKFEVCSNEQLKYLYNIVSKFIEER